MSAADDVLTSPEAGAKVIRGSAMRVAANASGILLGLATATLLLHALGVTDAGRYVTVMSLVSIASSLADAGLNATGSRDLAICRPEDRGELVANFLGLRLLITPFALALIVLFALLAGYPSNMVLGTVLAGTGLFLVAISDAALLRLTVELRNGSLALIDLLKQVVQLAGVALLVALGAHLTPFFSIQIAVGIAVFVVASVLTRALPVPHFDRARQRALLSKSLPIAVALVLGQVYFRLVIVLMSLIASSKQTGYFGGSLRAMETLINIPLLVATVALPVLAAAARDDRARLRYAIEGLSEGAVIAGALVILVTIRAAEPVMSLLGGSSFRPSGAVLRIQVGALLFISLYQIWTASLIALERQRDLVLANVAALVGVGVFAAVLVPQFGAQGGAVASVMGDALLAGLIFWRLRLVAGRLVLRLGFLVRVAIAAALAVGVLFVSGLPDLVVAGLAGLVFLAVGQLIGMIPDEVRDALGPRGWLARRGAT